MVLYLAVTTIFCFAAIAAITPTVKAWRRTRSGATLSAALGCTALAMGSLLQATGIAAMYYGFETDIRSAAFRLIAQHFPTIGYALVIAGAGLLILSVVLHSRPQQRLS